MCQLISQHVKRFVEDVEPMGFKEPLYPTGHLQYSQQLSCYAT